MQPIYPLLLWMAIADMWYGERPGEGGVFIAEWPAGCLAPGDRKLFAELSHLSDLFSVLSEQIILRVRTSEPCV
jgi:hypothetical protein